MVTPTYPPGALRDGTEGRVQLELSIDATGAVTAIDVIEAFPDGVFEDSVLDAVRQWRFELVWRDGEPVAATFGLEVKFRPDAGPASVSGWTSRGWGDGTVDSGPAKPVHVVPPAYPRKAMRQEIEGWVEVRLAVDEKGRVTDAKVVNAEPAGVFERKALEAVRRWRFAPPEVDGEPVTSAFSFRVRFRLPSE